jgi:hypothetical protein
MTNGIRFIFLSALIAVAMVFATSTAPAATPPQYVASYVGECCLNLSGAVEMEAGELRWAEFEAKNLGTETWQPTGGTPTRLGTSGDPDGLTTRNRSSAFAYLPFGPDGSWIDATRAATVMAAVAPAGFGNFRFRLHAPSTPGNYSEYFEPVVEGVSWLGQTSPCNATVWSCVFLPIVVRPIQPPNISFASLPGSVAQGSSLPFGVTATDNVGVDRIEILVDGVAGPVDDLPAPDSGASSPNPGNFSAALAPLYKSVEFSDAIPNALISPLSPGQHTFTARVFDGAGNATQISGPVDVLSDRDRDGFADAGDQCPDQGGPGSADGCPVPTRSTTALISLSGRNNGRKVKVFKAVVHNVDPGTSVSASCSKGCKPFTIPVSVQTRSLRLKRLVGEILPGGARVTVTTSRPRSENWNGVIKTYRARGHGGIALPVVDEGCLRPGSLTVRC